MRAKARRHDIRLPARAGPPASDVSWSAATTADRAEAGSRPAIWWPPRSAISATSRCGRWRRWPAPTSSPARTPAITRRLTERYGISTPLTPYHEHNAALARPKILAQLAQGASIALVSDAGTPLISDPGFKLVREALRRRPST